MSPRLTLLAIALALGGSALASLLLVMLGHQRGQSLPGLSAPGVDGGLHVAIAAATDRVRTRLRSPAPGQEAAATEGQASGPPSLPPTPPPEPAWVRGPLARAFAHDPIVGRLEALGQEVLFAEQVHPEELLVVVYEPPRGALSTWDDESRLTLYHRMGGQFEREAFLTKAGRSLPGRAAGLLLTDLDGDRLSEVFVVGRPQGQAGRVPSLGFRRAAPGQPYRQVWERSDTGACMTSTPSGRFLAYLHQADGPNGPWTLERFTLYGGLLSVADGQEIGPDDGHIRLGDPPPAPPQPGLRWGRRR